MTAEPEGGAGVSAEVRNQRETFSVTALELEWAEGLPGGSRCSFDGGFGAELS